MAIERLAAVTEKLNKIEEERTWLLSKEGKEASKQLREAELRLKKEKDLQDKRAKVADKEEDYEENRINRAAELERLEDEIREAKSKTARKDRKDEKKYNKQEAKLREKLEKEKRDFGKEFYDSIFGTYSLIGSLKNIFPKPVQILAGWGLDKFKKGIVGASKKIGSIAKSGFNAMMGNEPDADADPEAKAAAAEVKPEEGVIPKPKRKGGIQGWMQMLSGKGDDGADGADGAVIPTDSIAGDADDSLDELKKQTALLTTMVDAMEGPDASKSGEGIIEKADPTGTDIDIDIEKGGGFKKILAAIGIALALIAAPFIALMAFLKEFGIQTAKIAKGFGKLVGKALKPLKTFFGKSSVISKAVTGISNAFTSMSQAIKGSKLPGTISRVGKVFKDGMAALGKIFAPVTKIFKAISAGAEAATGITKTATAIKTFAANFGKVLGKIFWPITLIMGVFDFITGFIDGYKEDGILGGLEGGLSKMLANLIGFPLDLLKKAIAWIAGKFGFDGAKEALESFSFATLITDMIGGIFDMIKGAINWVKQLFTDPVAALQALWDGLMGGLKTISDVVMWPINTAINWILGVFGLKEEGAPKFSFYDFVFGENGIFAKAWKWITGIFSWGEEDEKAGEGFSVVSLVKGVFTSVKEWFGKLFSFDSAKDVGISAINVLTFVPNMILTMIGKVGEWLLGLFGFDDAAKAVANVNKFSIGDLVFKAVDAIAEWFKGLFDIDWDNAIKNLVPDWIKEGKIGKILGLGGGDDKEDPAITQAAERIEEGKERAGDITEEQTEIKRKIAEEEENIRRSEAGENVYVGREWKGRENSAEEIAELQAKLEPLQQESIKLQTEMAADEKIIAEGSQTTASAVQNSLPHMRTDIGLAMGVQHTPGNDIAAASSNMFGGGGGGGGTNVITNAPVTNSSSSTVINVQTPKMASDPNTQKQSGYALSGWAKFD